MTETTPLSPYLGIDSNAENPSHRGLLLGVGVGSSDPRIQLLTFFATGVLANSKKSVPQLIDEAKILDVSPKYVSRTYLKKRFSFYPSSRIEFHGISDAEQQAILHELNTKDAQMSQNVHEILSGDDELTEMFEYYKNLLRRGVLPMQRRIRKKTHFESMHVAEETAMKHFGIAHVQDLRTRIVNGEDPGNSAIRAFLMRRYLIGLDEDSPFKERQEVLVRDITREANAFYSLMLEHMSREVIDLFGELPYLPKSFPYRFENLHPVPVVKRAYAHRLQLIQRDSIDPLQQWLGHVENITVIEGKDIILGNIHQNVCMDFNAFQHTETCSSDSLLEILFNSSDDPRFLRDKARVRQMLQIVGKLYVLHAIGNLSSGLYLDCKQANNPNLRIRDSKHFQDIAQQSIMFQNVQQLIGDTPKIITDIGQIDNDVLTRYIAQTIALYGVDRFQAEGRFIWTDKGMDASRKRSQRVHNLSEKISRANISMRDYMQLLLQKVVSPTYHDISEGSFGSIPFIIPFPFVSIEALRGLIRPRFIIQGNPLKDMVALSKITEISSYPGDGSRQWFRQYSFPDTHGEKNHPFKLKATSPVVVGYEEITKGHRGSVLRVWLPQYAQIGAIHVRSTLSKTASIDYQYDEDYILQYDDRDGYYRIVFTQKGDKKIVQLGRECMYDIVFELGASGKTKPERVQYFTIAELQRLKEIVFDLKEAGYTRIARELEELTKPQEPIGDTLRRIPESDLGEMNKLSERQPILNHTVERAAEHKLEMPLITTLDIAEAIKRGSRYTFMNIDNMESVFDEQHSVVLPPPERDGILAAQCTHFATLLSTILTYIYKDSSDKYTFHRSTLFTAFNLGAGNILFGSPHADTRGGTMHRYIVHDAQPSPHSSLKDILIFLRRRFKAVESEVLGAVQGLRDNATASETVIPSLTHQHDETDPRSLFYKHIRLVASEYVNRMLDTAKLQLGVTQLSLHYQPPKYIAKTGGVLGRLAKMTQGDDPEIEHPVQRLEIVSELEQICRIWEGIDTGLDTHAKNFRARNYSNVIEELGPGPSQLRWVVDTLHMLIEQLRHYE